MTVSYRSQAVAGTVLGTPLAFALCALYGQFGPGDPATRFITAIFLIVPLWSAVQVWTLKRQDARAAWLGLAGSLMSVGAVILVARTVLGA